MIKFYKDVAMTTELDVVTRLIGDGKRDSFIVNSSAWKLCIDDMKETRFSIDTTKLQLDQVPKLNAKLVVVPNEAVNLTQLNTVVSKEFTNTLYVHTPTPITSDIYLKLEHDYSEITSALLKVFGASFTVCANCSSAGEGPHPVQIKLVVPATTDIRLFSDIQLCAMRIENVTDSSYIEINDDGELNMCKFAVDGTQYRRVSIYEL